MINVSIVLYHTPFAEVKTLVDTLRQNPNVKEIWLIDNSEIQTEAFMFLPATYIFNNNNLGYGSAHNIALRKSITSSAKYHLVINSDISFHPDILTDILQYVEQDQSIGLLMPKILNPDGTIQHLCKLLPTPLDLFARRFLPSSFTKRSTARYELHHSTYNQILNIPYLSGCFMFICVEALRHVGLFDERYFMYPEDIDLSRRIHTHYKSIFYPHVQVTHNHAKASYNNYKMLLIHIVNICRYFNKWGWFFDSERRSINTATLKQIQHH